jgi:hypothetical protein
MMCRACGNKDAYRVRTMLGSDLEPLDQCDRCTDKPAMPVYDCYVPVGGMHFEALSHPDFPESIGGHFCPDKATKAYYLKKYGLQEAGDRRHGTNNYDRIAARHARESLRK